MRPLRSALTMLSVVTACTVLTPSVAAAQKRERDRISREELEQPNQNDKDLYTVIRSLRPHFLQGARAASSIRQLGVDVDQRSVQLRVETPKPKVFVDGNPAGELDVLKNMRASEAEEVRYFSPTLAANEFGLGYEGGVIQVKRAKPKQTP